MGKDNKIYLIAIASFLLLLAWFYSTYKFYPGFELQVEGELEADLHGAVRWDFGYGFNNRDAIQVDLSAEDSGGGSPLGMITIEPAGFKPEESRGYLAWLVIPRELIDAQAYNIQGKHHWGQWLHLTSSKKGRQLALYPGTTFSVQSDQARFKLYYFQAPQAGFIKVSSEGGPTRYYNGYGKNSRWKVTKVTYKEDATGAVKYHFDPYNNSKRSAVKLPQQYLEKISLDFSSDTVKEVYPYSEIGLKAQLLDGNQVPHLKKIIINGIDIPIHVNEKNHAETKKISGVGLSRTDGQLKIHGSIFSYEFLFTPDADLENLELFVDGQIQREVGKTSTGKGDLQLSGTAPIEPFSHTLTSASLIDNRGQTIAFENTSDRATEMVIDLAGVEQTAANTLLLSFQVLFSLFLAICIKVITERFLAFPYRSAKDWAQYIFLHDQRWFFWVIFLFGVGVNALYLAADWPGSMTPDSVFMHKELKRLQFTNHHPYSYSLLLLALHHLYDAPVVVAVSQVLAFHALCGFVFYTIYRCGVSLILLIPLYLLVPLSIPVNLFNITLWKDIPYNMLVLFWALLLAYFYYLRKYEGRTVVPGNLVTFMLAISLLLLCTLRHNGIVYVPFIPFVLIIFCRMPKLWVTKLSLLSGLMLIVYFFVLPDLVLYKKPKLNNYAKKEATRYVGELASVSDAKEGEENYLEHYIAKRTRKFVATLGTSAKASTWYNDMHNPPQRWFSVDEARAEMVRAPLSHTLAAGLDRLLETRQYTGLFSGRFIFWNSLFAFVGLIVVAWLYKWLPVSALYSSFFLYQSVFMYFVVWERWRYLYFIYIGGLFLLPVVALELQKRRSKRMAGTEVTCY